MWFHEIYLTLFLLNYGGKEETRVKPARMQLGVPGDNNRARKSMTNTCKSGEKDSD
jgi:hypothetical protein